MNYIYDRNGTKYEVLSMKEENNNYYLTVNINNEPKTYCFDFDSANELMNRQEEFKMIHDELEARREIINRRQIRNLVHFTRLENLKSILRSGILSKEILINGQIEYLENDHYRLDYEDNHISTSVTFPNYKLLYKFTMDNPDATYVILDINPEIVNESLETIFCQTNAASSFAVHDKNAKGFENMFKGPKRNKYIPDNYTSDPQAEIMIPNKITLDNIDAIETGPRENIETKQMINNMAKVYKKNYYPNSSMFRPRSDWSDWKC